LNRRSKRRNSDRKRGKHTERKSNVEYKQRVKECRARRLGELAEENKADASAKEELQIRHTYNTNAVIPPPTQQLVEMVDDDVDDVLDAETDSSGSNEAPLAHLQ
jgi:glutamyl-tRNA reductase